MVFDFQHLSIDVFTWFESFEKKFKSVNLFLYILSLNEKYGF